MKKINELKAVIFDLDDTLYPEKEFVVGGFQAVTKYLAKRYKLKQSKIFDILKSDFEKGIRRKNFNLLFEKLNLPEKELKEIITVYRNHKPKIKLYPDAKKILKYLSKNKKIKFGVISDGPIKMQRNKITALGIKNYFKVVTLSDRWGTKYRKPHKKSFKITIKKLKVKPREVIYVADNLQKDFIGAKKLGILTIRIKRKKGIYSHIKESKKNRADLTIANLCQIKKLCLKNKLMF